MSVITRVIRKLLIKKNRWRIYMWSKDQIFVWDAKTSVRTLDKMNNSRPIIKFFISLYRTHRTYIFFLPILPTFFILPAHENARYVKMVFWLRIDKLRSFYKYIKRSNEKKKSFKRTEKINKWNRGPTNFIHVHTEWSNYHFVSSWCLF